MKKQLSFFTTPEQFKALNQIAGEFGYYHGSKPSVTGLVKAIADGHVVICQPEEEPAIAPTNGSEIETTKATSPADLAKKHADIAHVALAAECPELAEPHIRLAHAYALLSTLTPAQ